MGPIRDLDPPSATYANLTVSTLWKQWPIAFLSLSLCVWVCVLPVKVLQKDKVKKNHLCISSIALTAKFKPSFNDAEK